MKEWWKVWKYALGSYQDTEEYDDAIAIIRTAILLLNIIAATFIILLIQAPVFFWNLNNELASFSFHLNQRLDQEKDILTVLKKYLCLFVRSASSFLSVLYF